MDNFLSYGHVHNEISSQGGFNEYPKYMVYMFEYIHIVIQNCRCHHFIIVSDLDSAPKEHSGSS